WQNPEQLFVAQELINKVKSKCCGIKVILKLGESKARNYGREWLRQWLFKGCSGGDSFFGEQRSLSR
ncbi:hypothetical protein, partial [Bacteroides caccae]|uniref:hypothetical protein n=1 Tax=Bacteroides caccae TaxID=47678 RepID=UPI0019D64553